MLQISDCLWYLITVMMTNDSKLTTLKKQCKKGKNTAQKSNLQETKHQPTIKTTMILGASPLTHVMQTMTT